MCIRIQDLDVSISVNIHGVSRTSERKHLEDFEKLIFFFRASSPQENFDKIDFSSVGHSREEN